MHDLVRRLYGDACEVQELRARSAALQAVQEESGEGQFVDESVLCWVFPGFALCADFGLVLSIRVWDDLPEWRSVSCVQLSHARAYPGLGGH